MNLIIHPSSQPKPPRRYAVSRRCLLGMILALLATLLPVSAEDPKIATSDTEVKAAYVFNFTKFIQWPESAFTQPDAPFVVGVVGKDPLGKTLERALEGEKVRNRPVVLKVLTDTSDLKKCHLLYIGGMDPAKLELVISQVRQSPVLTISEVNGFCKLGGCVNFFAEGKGVRFEMNPSAMKQQGLEAHSRLLKLARIVER